MNFLRPYFKRFTFVELLAQPPLLISQNGGRQLLISQNGRRLPKTDGVNPNSASVCPNPVSAYTQLF
jgi:hypothetical protein